MQGPLTGIMQGFGALLTSPALLGATVLGVLLGLVVGGLPGLGSVTTAAVILPFTYAMDATFALVFVATMYVGAVFGGSASSILFNIPGEAPSAVTAIDGYPMTQRGRGAHALGVMITSSATGGLIGTLGLLFFSPLLVQVALSFDPIRYFALILLAMTVVGSLGMGSALKGYASGVLGLLLATIGTAPLVGGARFTFGSAFLQAGIDYVPVMIGAFALTEVFVMLRGKRESAQARKVKGRVLTLRQYWEVKWVNLRSGVLGLVIGVLPGAGSTSASFITYTLQKRISRTPHLYGEGEVKGVAAPEAANNSAAMGTLVPLLTLGIPGGAVAAIMFGIFQIHGLEPGPLLLQNNADIIYALIAALFIANALQLVLGVPQAKQISKLLMVPRTVLCTTVVLLSVVGAYAISNRMLDVWIALASGGLGYFMRKYGYSVPAMVLGLILGPLIEKSFLQGIIMTNGNPVGFISDPVAGPVLGLALLVLAYQACAGALSPRRATRQNPEEHVEEEGEGEHTGESGAEKAGTARN